jgi:hypothetical protein
MDMYAERFMQNVTYRVLQRKFFTYNLDLLEEIKYICMSFSTRSCFLPIKLGFFHGKYKFLVQVASAIVVIQQDASAINCCFSSI